jgi:hypothetical protein
VSRTTDRRRAGHTELPICSWPLAPNAHTERHQTSAARRARSALRAPLREVGHLGPPAPIARSGAGAHAEASRHRPTRSPREVPPARWSSAIGSRRFGARVRVRFRDDLRRKGSGRAADQSRGAGACRCRGASTSTDRRPNPTPGCVNVERPSAKSNANASSDRSTENRSRIQGSEKSAVSSLTVATNARHAWPDEAATGRTGPAPPGSLLRSPHSGPFSGGSRITLSLRPPGIPGHSPATFPREPRPVHMCADQKWRGPSAALHVRPRISV